MTKPIDVRAVLFEDRGVWVAQCVEYDIAAFAASLPELPRAFERAVAANLCANADLGRDGLDGVPPAPERFERLYEEADLGVTPRRSQPGSSSGVNVDLRVSEPA